MDVSLSAVVCTRVRVHVCVYLWARSLYSLLIAVETPLINTKRGPGGADGHCECVTSLYLTNLWDTTA